jgi:hypothetical protein
VVPARIELPRDKGRSYVAFADPSGGSSDSFTCAVGFIDYRTEVVTIAALREIVPPFSPESACAELATFLKSYGLVSVVGDRYAGSWVSEQFSKFGIDYKPSEKAKTDLYLDLLPAINSRRIELLDSPRAVAQIASLERRTSRGTGKDVIDHPQGAGHHDDLSNVIGGIASLLTGAGGYDHSWSGWALDTDAAVDPGYARAHRARVRADDFARTILKQPKPAWDMPGGSGIPPAGTPLNGYPSP